MRFYLSTHLIRELRSVNNLCSRNQNPFVYVFNFNIEEAPMKKVWNILFFVFFISCMFLLKPRQDIVFAAINESQFIRLFEEGKDFQLCIEENNTYTGTYTLSNDTLTLFYEEQIDFNKNRHNSQRTDEIKALPVKLYIDKGASEITSANGNSFAAEVYIDLRQNLYKSAPYRPGILKSQQAKISDFKARP